MKIALAKQVVQLLRALGRSMNSIALLFNKIEATHKTAVSPALVSFHSIKNKRKRKDESSCSISKSSSNCHGLITLHSASPSFINLDLLDWEKEWEKAQNRRQKEFEEEFEEAEEEQLERAGTTVSSVLSRAPSAQEIDKLADAFIENFHQKMRLEKQHSYRRYQEMLARGL